MYKDPFVEGPIAEDPIVEEVRRIRETLAAKYNFDIKAICDAARKRQRKSGHKVVSFAPKRKLSA
jgi:hypothetical protein